MFGEHYSYDDQIFDEGREKERDEIIMRMCDSGFSARKIAEIVGLTTGEVEEIISSSLHYA